MLVRSHSTLAKFALVIAIVMIMSQRASFGQEANDQVQVPIRIVWGANQPFSYVGEITGKDLHIDIRHELSVTQSGTIRRTGKPNQLQFVDPSTRFGGVDLLVRGTVRSELVIRVSSFSDSQGTNQPAIEKTLSLESILSGSHDLPLGNTARLVVDRPPGSVLAVTSNKQGWVFEPNQPVPLQVAPTWSQWKNQTAIIEWSLVHVRSQTTLNRGSTQLSLNEYGCASPISLDSLVAPQEEGVYELHLHLRPRRSLTNVFGSSSMERRVQFVVQSSALFPSPPLHSDTPGKSSKNARWDWSNATFVASQSMEKSLPVSHGAWDRFTKNLRKLGSQWNQVEDPTIEIGPGDMLRIPIEIQETSKSYVVSFRTENSIDAFDVNIVESNPTRSDLPARTIVSAQSQPHLSELLTQGDHPQRRAYSLRMTPTQQRAELILINRRNRGAIRADSFQIEPEHHPVIDRNNTASFPWKIELLTPNDWKELMTKGRRLHEGTRYDTWLSMTSALDTWLQGCCERGADAVAIPILSLNGCLFPTERMTFSPSLETGTFDSFGRDPDRKDVVRWLYGACMKRGIQFLPVFDWSGSLHGFKQLQVKESLTGVRDPSKDSTYQRWNPFQAEVQLEMKSLLREFESRYGGMPQYKGFAFQMGDSSSLALAPSSQDISEGIIDRLAQDLPGKLPTQSDDKRATLIQLSGGSLQNKYQQQLFRLFDEWEHDLRFVFSSTPRVQNLGSRRYTISTIHSRTINPSTLVSRRWWVDGLTPIVYESSAKESFIPSPSKPPFARDWLTTAIPVERSAHQRQIDRVRLWKSDKASTTGHSSAVILNDNPWETMLEVRWSVIPGTIRTSSASGVEPNPDAFTSYFLKLPPNDIVWLEWNNPNADLVGWSSNEQLSTELLATTMQRIETAVNQHSIPTINQDLLTNPGFELQPDSDREGSIAGWVTSLNPKASVRLGRETPHSGNQFVEVHCDPKGASAWLQSCPFELQSSRFQVGVHQRLASLNPAAFQWTLSVWNPGQERYDLVAKRNMVVDPQKQPVDQWTRWTEDFSEELTALGAEQVRTFRLQLDIQAAGQIDIDSVFASTDYLQERERIEIRNALFLARRSLSEGQSDAAFRLLDSPTTKTLLMWSIENATLPGSLDPLESPHRILESDSRPQLPVSKRPASENRPSDRRWRFWNR
jgi:hypothetical protein